MGGESSCKRFQCLTTLEPNPFCRRIYFSRVDWRVVETVEASNDKDVEGWIIQLKSIYAAKNLSSEFDKEVPFLGNQLHELKSRFAGRYRLIEPLDMGGSGIVFRILDNFSHYNRA